LKACRDDVFIDFVPARRSCAFCSVAQPQCRSEATPHRQLFLVTLPFLVRNTR